MNIKELAAEIRLQSIFLPQMAELEKLYSHKSYSETNKRIKTYRAEDVDPLLDMIDRTEEGCTINNGIPGTWLFIPDKPRSLKDAAREIAKLENLYLSGMVKKDVMQEQFDDLAAALEREE